MCHCELFQSVSRYSFTRKPEISSVFLFKTSCVIAKARPNFQCTRNAHYGRACGNLQDKAQIHTALRHDLQFNQSGFLGVVPKRFTLFIHVETLFFVFSIKITMSLRGAIFATWQSPE
jgi:hypothetical protein